jgi:DNA-binding PadR family transcriptional regulator
MSEGDDPLEKNVQAIAAELEEYAKALEQPSEAATRAYRKAILDKAIRFLGRSSFEAVVVSVLSESELDAFDAQERLKKFRVQLLNSPPMALFGILHELEELEWIEARTTVRDGEEIRLYRATDKGRIAARKNIPQEMASWIEALHLRGATGQ